MQNGQILNFSAFMTELAECTEQVAPVEFRQSALAALQCHIEFAAGIWGSAAIGAGLAFREVVLTGLPESAIAEVEAGASADPRLLSVLGAPGTTVAYTVGADDPEIMQVQMARYGVKHIMSTAFFDAELGLASGIVLLGADTAPPFDQPAQLFMEAAFGHLLRCWSENQIRALGREIAAAAGLSSYAAASHHGVVSAAQDEFLTLFRREWPGWRGPLLPDAVRGLLLGPEGGRHMGQEIVLSVRHGHDVSLLLIRERVVADDLRPRELAVAQLCAGGASYRDIAESLGIAPATARNHIAAVHRRLGVSRNSEISALLAAAR
ncbi:MAG: helix-turn-helix transcriptional regulator [Acetobacteraceae bacterium]|nr:helix-turn-helix transcriptional regulator [Acetobacteraceae bacterium]